jgi:quercetin dioxygenase-like cupin family protein
MMKVSKATAAKHWSVEGRFDSAVAEVDGYSIEFLSCDVDFDLAFVHKGQPNDQCQASHVGYVVKGKFTVHRADGTETVFEGGDAFVITPGHVLSAAALSEFVVFTPIEQARAQAAVVEANMKRYAADHYGIEASG